MSHATVLSSPETNVEASQYVNSISPSAGGVVPSVLDLTKARELLPGVLAAKLVCGRWFSRISASLLSKLRWGAFKP